MKKINFFIVLTFVSLIFFSCGRKEVKDIIKLKKDSNARVAASVLKYADEYFLQSDIQNNGSVVSSAYILDYNVSQNTITDEMPILLESITRNKIGMQSVFINNGKSKEYKYRYSLKNAINKDSDTDFFSLKIDDKNIEAASPAVYDKTFFLPAKGWGKLIKILFPTSPVDLSDLDFSYTAIKNFYSFELNKSSQKRYDKVMEKMYANADIKKTNTGYMLSLKNQDLKEIPALLLNALKNDNRFKPFFGIYEKIIFKPIFDELKKSIDEKNLLNGNVKITEEIILKNGYIQRNIIKYISENNDILFEFVYELDDYEHPFNDMKCRLKVYDPEKNKNFNINFTASGKSTSSLLDTQFKFEFDIGSEAPNINIDYDVRIDKTKVKDNFYIGYDVFGKEDNLSDAPEMLISTKISGDFKKFSDSVEYLPKSLQIKTVENKTGKQLSIDMELNSKFIISKEIINDFSMPEEKIDVITTKPDEWQKIQKEISETLQQLFTQLAQSFNKPQFE